MPNGNIIAILIDYVLCLLLIHQKGKDVRFVMDFFLKILGLVPVAVLQDELP